MVALLDQTLASFSSDCPNQSSSPLSHSRLLPWEPQLAPPQFPHIHLKLGTQYSSGWDLISRGGEKAAPLTLLAYLNTWRAGTLQVLLKHPWGQGHPPQERDLNHLKWKSDHRKIRHGPYITEKRGSKVKIQNAVEQERQPAVGFSLCFCPCCGVEYKSEPKLLDKQSCLCKFDPAYPAKHFIIYFLNQWELCYSPPRYENTLGL